MHHLSRSRRVRLSTALPATALALAACVTPRSGTVQAASGTAAAPVPARPIPAPVPATSGFDAAVAAGTRTRTGIPGPRYWQQRARYRLEAELDPATARLAGRGTVDYVNASPDTLRTLVLHLRDNLFAPGALRNVDVPVVGGVEMRRVALVGAGGSTRVLGAPAGDGPGWTVSGTAMQVVLDRPLAPGDSARLDLAWALTVPPDGAPRGGHDAEIFYIAYWYPQLAVYDDVSRSWQRDQYMGNSEFYMGYADYDVSLTVPSGWLVAATGTLANPEQVLTAQTRRRLGEARRGRSVVHGVGAEDRGPGRATLAGSDGRLTWRFRAANVRDFAWGTSDEYLWDATHAVVGDADCPTDATPNGAGGCDGLADTADVYSFWRPDRAAWAWDQSARYAQHSVEFLSRFLWPYPYPHMTAVDGVASCAGMEYPMMTCIGGRRDTLALYSVTVHEIGHMWFPMQVGSDEQRYAWQDEGLTRFNQAQAMREFFGGYDLEAIAREQYLTLARQGSASHGGGRGEVELMRHGDLYPVGSPAYGIASYAKMATNMRSLRALLGDSLFLSAYREYGRRWIGRHPMPDDFRATFEDVAKRDLGWFWRSWWYETWTLDQAVASVTVAEGVAEVVVADRGDAPMPVRLAITRADGSVQRTELPVEPWLAGARRLSLRLPAQPAIARVEIDPEQVFPDIDRANNVWMP